MTTSEANGTSSPAPYVEIQPFQGVILGLIATPGVIANIFAILITAKILRHQKLVPNVLVFGLACCDLFGIIMICWPTWVCYATGKWLENGSILCKFQGFMTLFSSLGSGLMATVLAVDRYLSIKAPFFHRQKISYRFGKRAVVSIIVFAAIISIMPALRFGSFVVNKTGTYCTINWFAKELKDQIFAYIFASIGLLMILVVLISNIHVFILIIKRRNSSKKLGGMRSMFRQVNKPKKTASEKLQQQYQRMMVIISVLFLICWTPFMIRIIGNISGVWESWSADLQASRLLLLNLVLDPFIYVLARKQYRDAFVRYCCCCCPCGRKERKDSIKIRFAYSASLTGKSRSSTDPTQYTNTSSQTFKARDEVCIYQGEMIGSNFDQSTDVLVRPNANGKDNEKDKQKQTDSPHRAGQETEVCAIDNQEQIAGQSQRNSKEDRFAQLKDKQGILPTVTEDEVREALRNLSIPSGMDNAGLVDDTGISLFEEVMETLKDCFEGDGSLSSLEKEANVASKPPATECSGAAQQHLLSIEENGDQSTGRKTASKGSPMVNQKALQVMEYILAKKQNKSRVKKTLEA